MQTNNLVKCLLLSVGRSPEPLIKSINQHTPENVIFFVSEQSRSAIETEIRQNVSVSWKDQEIITTPDPQDLVVSIAELYKELPKKLSNLNSDFNELYVDYTGGTKVMSTALVVSTIIWPVRYCYVGGTQRTKENKGIVVDGTEKIQESSNPWDVLAIETYRNFRSLFGQGAFEEAKRLIEKEKNRTSKSIQFFFNTLEDLCEVFHKWDHFEYSSPGHWQKTLYDLKLQKYGSGAEWKQFIDDLEVYMEPLSSFQTTVKKIRTPQKFTQNDENDGQKFKALIIDLVVNAVRSARQLKRYDDGVSRLYSAIEKLAKLELMNSFGIDNGKTEPDQVPESVREEFQARYKSKDGYLKFGLYASYQLLAEKGHPLGEKYNRCEDALRNIVTIRNSSLLAHGWEPVRSDTFDKLLNIALNFLDIKEDDLPEIPSFPKYL